MPLTLPAFVSHPRCSAADWTRRRSRPVSRPFREAYEEAASRERFGVPRPVNRHAVTGSPS